MPLFFPSQHLKMGGVAPGMAVRGTEAESRIDLSLAQAVILLFSFCKSLGVLKLFVNSAQTLFYRMKIFRVPRKKFEHKVNARVQTIL